MWNNEELEKAEPTAAEMLVVQLDSDLAASRREETYLPLDTIVVLLKRNLKDEVPLLIKALQQNGQI